MNTSWIDPTGITNDVLGKGQSAPPTPDYAGAAQAQGAANEATARIQGRMSNPNIVTPQGSQTVTWDGDQPTVTRSLSPDQQGLYDQQNRISRNLGTTAETGLSRVSTAMGQPFDMSGVPGRVSGVQPGQLQTNVQTGDLPAPNFNFQRGTVQGTVAGAGDQARNAVEQALYGRATARLDPRFQQSDDNLHSNLIAQGIHPGTEAYDRAMKNAAFVKNDAYSSAQNDAIAAGGAEQSRQFGMNLGAGNFANSAQAQEAGQNLAGANLGNSALQQAVQQRINTGNFANTAQQTGFNEGTTNANLQNQQRQQAIQEEAYLRQLPLQELNSLRTGAQPTMPQFQNFTGTNVAGTPVFAAAQAQGQNATDIYNAQVGQQNAQMGAMGQMGAAALPFLFSDRRLKHKIRRLGVLPSGLPYYEFEYLWGGDKKLGVMAQEAAVLFPEAVRTIGGWLAVDYGRIY